MYVAVHPNVKTTHRHLFQNGHTETYDELYPYRIAARKILREDERHRHLPRESHPASPQEVEPLARELARVSRRMVRNRDLIMDSFRQWFRHVRRKEDVVILGLEDDRDPFVAEARRTLRRNGAVEIGDRR